MAVVPLPIDGRWTPERWASTDRMTTRAGGRHTWPNEPRPLQATPMGGSAFRILSRVPRQRSPGSTD